MPANKAWCLERPLRLVSNSRCGCSVYSPRVCENGSSPAKESLVVRMRNLGLQEIGVSGGSYVPT